MHQLSMLDILEPPPPPVERQPYVEMSRRKVGGRAYGGEYDFTVTGDNPEPFEIEVRGIPCTITYSTGFATYVIDGPGSLFWSETGFRSFGYQTEDRDTIRAMIERYIDGPTKDGQGCGGNLVRWWPSYIRDWQSGMSWRLTYPRDEMWTQWGPERHAEIWAAHDAKIAAAEVRMWAEGIDPNDVGKPAHHKGRWPHFTPTGD